MQSCDLESFFRTPGKFRVGEVWSPESFWDEFGTPVESRRYVVERHFGSGFLGEVVGLIDLSSLDELIAASGHLPQDFGLTEDPCSVDLGVLRTSLDGKGLSYHSLERRAAKFMSTSGLSASFWKHLDMSVIHQSPYSPFEIYPEAAHSLVLFRNLFVDISEYEFTRYR